MFRRFLVREVIEALEKITHQPLTQGHSQSFHFGTTMTPDSLSENKDESIDNYHLEVKTDGPIRQTSKERRTQF